MTRRRLYLGVTAVGVAAAVTFWPVPRLDLSPVQQLPAITPMDKPERQPHPRSVYTPKALR